MKRPREVEYIGTYVDGQPYMNTILYVNDLEKYCDELEKALDRVCDKLAIMQLEYYSTVNDDLSTKEQWREWALNDDE